MTEKYSEEIEQIVNNKEIDTESMMKKVDEIQNRIKFSAFGKTKLKKIIKPKDEIVTEESDEEGPRKLLIKQVEKLEEAIKQVSKENKSRCGRVFEMKTIVDCPKKGGQEALAIKDPKNNEVVVNS
jgi:hypothetical protein